MKDSVQNRAGKSGQRYISSSAYGRRLCHKMIHLGCLLKSLECVFVFFFFLYAVSKIGSLLETVSGLPETFQTEIVARTYYFI